ncbi:MAG: gliding motility-associated C-terminal domain-containing protein [Bacteroidetes bacterium]|nr:gliding motility-associated C-terminal domain-containing protein [Bacteroidota bacterium]
MQGYGKYAGVSSLSLTNGGEKISIRDPQGFPIDSVTYSDSWYGSSYKKDGGWSLERVDTTYSCPNPTNWKPCEHIQGGTPGQQNSVAGTIIDNIPPILLRAFCNDSASVILVFNEPIDPNSVANINNYSVNNSLLLTSAGISGENNQRIRIKFQYPVLPSTVYTIEVSGIADCSGNNLLSGSTTRFGIADSIRKNEIILNEVLFDPFESGFDFVEIFNKSRKIKDLNELKISAINQSTNEPEALFFVTEEPWLIFPDEFLVITENSSVVASQYYSSYPFHFLQINQLPGMNIDEGHIAIIAGGQRIDEFKYNKSYHFELLNNTKGISLEKINPTFNSMDASSWHSASTVAGFATPGFKNSQFSELGIAQKNASVTPEIFTPNNDGKDDFVTFSIVSGSPGYISNIWIYNVSGQVIFTQNKNNLSGTSEIFTWDGVGDDGTLAPFGIYIALLEVFNLKGAIQKYKLPFVVAVKF